MKQAQKALEQEKWKEADCGKRPQKPLLRPPCKVRAPCVREGKEPKGEDQEQRATASKPRTSRPSEAASASSHNKGTNAEAAEGHVKAQRRTASSNKADDPAAKQREDVQQEGEEKKAKKEKKDRKREKSPKEKKENVRRREIRQEAEERQGGNER